MGTTRVTGAELDYITEGSGPAVLSIGSPTYYRRVYSPNLRESLSLTFGNLRHWVPRLDDIALGTITIDTYAADIEAVRRDALGDEKVVVMGHSIHGVIAVEYARRYPDRVRGVVSVAAPPVGAQAVGAAAFWEADATPERKAAHAANLAKGHLPTSMESGKDLADLYVARAAMYWNDPMYDASWLWQGVDANMPLFQHLMSGLFGEYRVEPLDLPTFVALGRFDYVVPYSLWDSAKGALNNLRYELYEHSGHTPPLDEPKKFDADLLDFIASLPS